MYQVLSEIWSDREWINFSEKKNDGEKGKVNGKGLGIHIFIKNIYFIKDIYIYIMFHKNIYIYTFHDLLLFNGISTSSVYLIPNSSSQKESSANTNP